MNTLQQLTRGGKVRLHDLLWLLLRLLLRLLLLLLLLLLLVASDAVSLLLQQVEAICILQSLQLSLPWQIMDSCHNFQLAASVPSEACECCCDFQILPAETLGCASPHSG